MRKIILAMIIVISFNATVIAAINTIAITAQMRAKLNQFAAAAYTKVPTLYN